MGCCVRVTTARHTTMCVCIFLIPMAECSAWECIYLFSAHVAVFSIQALRLPQLYPVRGKYHEQRYRSQSADFHFFYKLGLLIPQNRVPLRSSFFLRHFDDFCCFGLSEDHQRGKVSVLLAPFSAQQTLRRASDCRKKKMCACVSHSQSC